jgi:hypothetical protein
MFNAFSSPNPFNSGGVTAKPLFGSKKETSAESKQESVDEEGEMEESEQQQQPDV